MELSGRRLSIDQRHKGRILATYSQPIAAVGDVTIGVIQAFNSGTPYNASATSPLRRTCPRGSAIAARPRRSCTTSPAATRYRGENWSSTDLAATLNYRLPGGSQTQVFLKADVINLFNQSAIVNPFYINQGVLTNVTTPARYAAFNPFTTTPVQGVHWDLGPTFGQPQNRFAYQTPRTYRFAVGVRF